MRDFPPVAIPASFLCFCLVVIFKAYLPNSSRGTHSTVYFNERDIVQNWDDLKYCLALDEFRTMTAAAKALGTNTATVSRHLERLTEEAGQPLFIPKVPESDSVVCFWDSLLRCVFFCRNGAIFWFQ